jgi:glycosyltransferase involved in cell wall biosynthesis
MSRILLSAYVCEPGTGSEPAVGWSWATHLAALGHDVWVITRTSNRDAIESSTQPALYPGLHFIYCDLAASLRRCKAFPGFFYLYYFLWQLLAFARARTLNRGLRFHYVHHVTFVSMRAPSFMGWLGIPFYFGPVSGGERVPPVLRRSMSPRARAFERLRDCANLIVRFDPLMRLTFKKAARIYLTSQASLHIVPAPYRDKCVVQFAVGLQRTQLGFSSRRIAPHDGKLRCLYLGRLLEWKGLRLALFAIRRLKAQGAPVYLTLIGDGPARLMLRCLAQTLNIQDRVEFHPWMPHSQVQQQFKQHHVLLFPSLRDSGGMAVLEALAHGLPVVCTDLGGPATIVSNQCGRVISTPGRNDQQVAAAFADQLLTLARNRGLLDRLSINARRRAWDFDFATQVEHVYQPATAPVTPLAEAVLS